MAADAAAEVEYIQVSGVKTEILRQGSGAPLLFLHPGDGLLSCRPILDELAERFEVIAPSHPGFGKSDLPDGYSTIDDLAHFYLELIETLDLKNAVVVGVSFGGWLAAEVATKSTRGLAAMVLVSPLGVKLGGPDAAGITDVFYYGMHEANKLMYRDDSSAPEVDIASMSDDEVYQVYRNRESFALFSWSPMLHNPKLRQRLHRIRIPTQVLWGSEDRIAGADHGRAFATEIPGAAFHEIAGAGHYLHAERAAEVAKHVVPAVAASAVTASN